MQKNTKLHCVFFFFEPLFAFSFFFLFLTFFFVIIVFFLGEHFTFFNFVIFEKILKNVFNFFVQFNDVKI